MKYEDKYERKNPSLQFTLDQIQQSLQKYLENNKISKIELLSGGFLNTNYKISFDNNSNYLFRISNRAGDALAIEISILKALAGILPVSEVFHFEINNTIINHPVGLIEFLPGKPLYLVEDDFTPDDIRDVATDIGKIMAKYHQITFPTSGFFGANFKLINKITNFSHAINFELNRCMNEEILHQRLTKKELDDLKYFLKSNSKEILDSLPQRCLTHADFNQKNILVDNIYGSWSVTGIIDWEFALSGPYLFDFGNFFRFESEMPFYQESLIDSYKKNGGKLPRNWKKIAKFLDILPQLQFLVQSEDTPVTFATAKSIIHKTINNW